MARQIEFWFEFASTYSYLAAERIESVAIAAGVEVLWRPFLLGPIFAAQGWRDSPFNIFPAKGRYMWRDMERLALAYRLPFRRPSTFPRNGLAAARLALAHDGAPWIGAFVRAVYRANFADDRDIADADVLADLLRAVGCDPEAAFAAANADSSKARLKEQTARAQTLGLFGAPSFSVGAEIFWGNDRLEQAVGFAAGAQTGG